MSGTDVRRIVMTFVWGQTNIGDAAITPGTLAHLKRHFPDAQLTIISGSSAGTERYEASRRYLESATECEVLPNPFSEMTDADELGIFFQACQFERESTRFFRTLYKVSPRVAQAFLEADLVYFNSGMTLTYNNRGMPGVTKRLLVNWMPIMLAGQLGVPCVLWGQSCGPLDWPGPELAQEYLPKCTAITTRETESLRFLQEDLGVRGPHLAFAPDTTIYFDRRDDAWADAFMTKHNLTSGQFLTAIIRTFAWWGRKLEGERLERHMDAIAGAIERWVSETGLPVVIAPECLREIPRAEEFLLPRLSEKTLDKCVFMNEFWLPDQARSLYTHTRVMMSMELHSIILALPEGIPVVHPYFDEMGPKTWMVRDAGFEDFLFDIDRTDGGVIGDALIRAHGDRDALSKKALEATKRFQTAGDEQIERLKSLL